MDNLVNKEKLVITDNLHFTSIRSGVFANLIFQNDLSDPTESTFY